MFTKESQPDWNRIEKAIIQYARRKNKIVDQHKLKGILNELAIIREISGSYSSGRAELNKIGYSLLEGNPIIAAPSCPDYSHTNGCYNFRSLGSDVSLLALKHIEFLKKLTHLIPRISIVILIADQEILNEEVRKAVNVTYDEFNSKLRGSYQATQKLVHELKWEVAMMTKHMPNLLDDEHKVAQWIASDSHRMERIINETCMRSSMYKRINASMNESDMRQRTIATAAQYIALGNYAAKNNWIICNHTTTNLSWYKETSVGVIHNDICIY